MEEIEILIGLLKQKFHEKKPSIIGSINNQTQLPELATKYNTSLINKNHSNSNCNNNINFDNLQLKLKEDFSDKNLIINKCKSNNKCFVLPMLQQNKDSIEDGDNNFQKIINSNIKLKTNFKNKKNLYPYLVKNRKDTINFDEEKKSISVNNNFESNININTNLGFLNNCNYIYSGNLTNSNAKFSKNLTNKFGLEKLNSFNHNSKKGSVFDFHKKDYEVLNENENKQIEEENEKENSNNEPPYESLVYLDFRPYIDSIEIKIKSPKDLGYYYKMLGSECKLIKNTLEDNGFKETSSNNFTLLWSSGPIKTEMYKCLKKYQKLNHFPKSSEITRKDSLYKNICKLQSHLQANQKHFNFIPESYILPNEHKFLQESMERDQNCIWIIKPVASSQGKGIFITNRIVEIPSGPNLIASKYIINPFLIDGYKFDIRIYVIVTSMIPLRMYIYEEGLVRFATEKYFIGQPIKNNRFMHLTNYSLNKNSKNFIPNNDPFLDNIGSKWSLTALKNFFEKNNINSKDIFDKVDDIIIKTILSAEDTISTQFINLCNVRNGCFELFGFDILLDSNLNPWLLEVNLSPSMNCDSPLDQKIKSELIAECFNLSRIFPFYMRNQEHEFIKINQETKNLEIKILKETANLDFMKDFKINKEIREIIWEAEEELKRLKTFRRIFPSLNSLNYRKYFYNENPINLYSILYLLERDENIDLDQFRKIKKLNLKNIIKK